MKRFGVGVIAVCIMLTGCQQVAKVVDPDVAQLDRFEAPGATPQSIADETVVACKPTSCAKLYARHGVANLQVGMQGRTPPAACPSASPAARDRFDAAASDLAKALDNPAGLDPSALPDLWRDRAQALYCRAEQDTAAGGLPFAAQAESASAHVGTAAGELLGGWAALYVATFGSDPTSRCAAAKSAATHAATGLTRAPDADTAKALNRLVTDARTAATALRGCTVRGTGA